MAETECKSILRISDDVAERITTAQVVVSLSSALRQLVDNSIDAEAKTIDIRAKNYGFECLEIQDNGLGIEERNFDALCKPHSTSKLTKFSDFAYLATLGFRGEALNALCALSTLTVFTRSADSNVGTRLAYDHKGNPTSITKAAREIGTTIIVESLFETLPVRRKELERTAKKDFNKLLTMVQTFALMCPQVKFLCSNQVNGKKQNMICTPGGNSTVRDVVSNLFGSVVGRTLKAPLVELLRKDPDEEINAFYSIFEDSQEVYSQITLSGFVSNCEHGSGRSTSDRQFVYINNRPVDYQKVCRVVNEVYQMFNKSQYPTLVLFVGVPAKTIDVNVTPDKKTVMFNKEKHLFALLRSSLLATYKPLLGMQTSVRSSVEDRRNVSAGDKANDSSPAPAVTKSLPNIEDLLREARAATLSRGKSSPSGQGQSAAKRFRYADVMEKTASFPSPSNTKSLEEYSFTIIPHEKEPPSAAEDRPQPTSSTSTSTAVFPPVEKPIGPPLLRNMSRRFDVDSRDDDEMLDQVEKAMREVDRNEEVDGQGNAVDGICSGMKPKKKKALRYVRTQQKIKFSMKKFCARIEYLKMSENETAIATPTSSSSSGEGFEFHCGIRPDDSEDAEKELNRALKKSDFANMEIVGQFNKGFIICKFRRHLFIVDQHASDEKFNFEKLQRSAKLSMQPLVSHVALNLGAVQEMTIRDNIHVFRANGFDFKFVDGEDGCMRGFMTARPEILSQYLTNHDLEEIVAMVAEYPGQMYRPTKIRKIFASRACRKSIMVGMSLDDRQMRKVVHNLGLLDQPWNCPHGRPTIRHLFDFSSTRFSFL